MKIAMPFGMSFDRVLNDAVTRFSQVGKVEAVCLVLGPRDDGVIVEGSTVTWTDRGETRSVDVGVPVTPVRLSPPQEGLIELEKPIAAVRTFGPDIVVLNGGTTPVQGVLWGQTASKYDVQRDGNVELAMRSLAFELVPADREHELEEARRKAREAMAALAAIDSVELDKLYHDTAW